MAAAPSSLPWAQARHIETVIFVDVDGVLNIGAQDKGEAPLLLNKTNIDISMRAWGHHHNHSQRDCIEKMVSVAERELGHGENCTYAKFACATTSSVSDELAKRLADIIKAAGDRDRVAVVLSSNWRKMQHAGRVRKLEETVSRFMPGTFTFDAKTPNRSEQVASDRLESIGDFLTELSNQRSGLSQPLQALVLEDFFITDMDGWLCNGTRMDSVADAEGWLLARGSPAMQMKVRIVHCYDQWNTATGLEVKVGCGLTLEKVDEAMAFLNGGSEASADLKTQIVSQDSKCRGLLKHSPLLAKICGDVTTKAPTPPQSPPSSPSYGPLDSLRWPEYLSLTLPWVQSA